MKKYISIISIFIVLLSVSCEEYLDVNTDPNNPVEVTPDLILPVGQTYTADLIQQMRGVNHLGNMMMFNYGEAYGFSWYDQEFEYRITTTFYDKLFNETFERALKQYGNLDKIGDDYMSYKAISNIMKVYHFQILVDLYGDIPYFNALNRGGNPTPGYDNAAEIYADLMVQLTEAVNMINTAAEAEINILPENDDVIFEGNMLKWKQFAHSLKIRILNRASGTNIFNINTELAIINEEGSGFIDDNVAVNPGYTQDNFKQSPQWEELGWDIGGTVRMNNDATCATQYVLDYLADNSDPRINYLYEEPATGHLGVNQGAPNEDAMYAADFVSNIGPGILKGPDQDAVIFSLADHKFNMAELALNGYDVTGDAETYYNEGVAASFAYLGVSESLSDYLSQALANVNYQASPNKLEAIITQKWIASNGVEASQSWFDYSRTGYPLNHPVSEDASTSDRPVRLAYPSSETTANPNLPNQPNVFSEKIFWAQ